MDEKLAWFEHKQIIKCNIDKGIGIICNVRRLLNSKTLCTLYCCYPSQTIGSKWGDIFKAHLQALIKLQKRVLRIISYSKWNASAIIYTTIIVSIKLHCLCFAWRPYQRHMYSGNFSWQIEMSMITLPDSKKSHIICAHRRGQFYADNHKL